MKVSRTASQDKDTAGRSAMVPCSVFSSGFLSAFNTVDDILRCVVLV